MGILRRSTGLAAANLVAFACSLGIVTALPAWAGAARVVSNLDEASDEPANVILSQIKHTLRRDWWLSLVALAMIGTGVVSLLITWGWFGGWLRVALILILVILYLAIALVLVNYTHAASTLPMEASYQQVIEQTMRRIVEYPRQSLLSALAVVLCAPLWLLAPLAVALGIVVPAWLVHRIWAPIEVQVPDEDPLWNDAD